MRIRVIAATAITAITAITAVTAAVACLVLLVSASPASAGDYGGGTFTIDDPTLERGQELRLSGTGCRPGATVVVDFDGRRIGTPTADANGVFELVGAVPEGTAPGHYTVTATCGDLVQSLEVTVAAEAVAAPAAGTMARTGTDIGPLLRTAAALVLVGTGLVFLARRRRATVRPV